MTLDEAHKTIDKLYNTATEIESINNPIVWALYQTWSLANTESVQDKTKNELKATIQWWRGNNPNGKKSECHKATGISRPTIDKYWEV